MTMSDIIENFIKETLEDLGGSVELKRNELAGKFNCVPSQINYVISTRFTTERGYMVESRRGGGGYIVIRRVGTPKNNLIMHVVNSLGGEIDYGSAVAVVGNLFDSGLLSARETKIILTAMSDKILPGDKLQRDAVRANMLKKILLHLI